MIIVTDLLIIGHLTSVSPLTILYLKFEQVQFTTQTESPIFVILCVLCFQRQSFLTFILLPNVVSKIAG